jgi:hypothetical protein
MCQFFLKHADFSSALVQKKAACLCASYMPDEKEPSFSGRASPYEKASGEV